jgi:4-alpha-glucanotransferase
MTIDPQHLLQTPAGPEWKQVGIRHHHGFNLPLFSLRTQNSCGIGEFPDLIPLFDWCKSLGMDVIQLLPLNDGGPETSPYCALSAIALNPLHLGLSTLPYLDKVPDAEAQINELRQYNATQRIDYAGLYEARQRFLKHYFKHVSPLIINSYDYLLFLSRFPWIEPYALFKAIKIDRQWQSWQEWPLEMRNAGPKEYLGLLHRYNEEVAFQRCIQYLCFQQLQQVKKIAEQKGIFIKGDIPILINFESADVWNQRHLFLLDHAAGAPPDMYAKEGQYWGFPLYQWEAHEKDHYNWWKIRLNAASYFYHIYRIDHVVGFFRIWGIPKGKKATEGQFFPVNESEWISQGEKALKMMLNNCQMLPIGEDLGTVPPVVRTCLRSLGICGTKVMRWERNWDTDKSFISPKEYLMESMTTVSTHDSETLQLWWQNQPEEAMDFCKFKGWDYTKSLSSDRHLEILQDSHRSGSLFHINLLNEYLAVVPGLTWPELQDERINIPGSITNFNWSYRFRPPVEEIISNQLLKQVIQKALSK